MLEKPFVHCHVDELIVSKYVALIVFLHCHVQLIVQSLPEQRSCGSGRGAVASLPKSKPALCLISIVSDCTDVVAVHCCVVDIGQIDLEQICTRINK